MDQLHQAHCVPCEGGIAPAGEKEIATYLVELPAWQLIEVDHMKRIRKKYAFKDFATALAFTNRIGQIAEEEGHHPALLTEWGSVEVTWWTHAIDGLHRNDFIMAARTDEAFQDAPGGRRPF